MSEETEFVTREDLETLLVYKLGSLVQIHSFTTARLTQPGENYGSNILAVEVVLKPDYKKLSLVVKLVPESPYLRQIFQCGISVRKEMDMYLLVSPEYEKIQRESNIPDNEFLDVFPICYGARATKDEDIGQPADEGSAIVLENLKVKGYECGDRLEGFDLAHTEYIVKHLARFHATAVAIKLKKPDVFEKTVKKACVRMYAGPRQYEPGKNPALESRIQLMHRIPGCSVYIDRLMKVMEEHEERVRTPDFPPPAEPFATICHNDFWTSNMMVTYSSSTDRKIPSGLKIVDFQIAVYDSPAKDLLFFLYTSTRAGLVEKHYDELVRLYHASFVEWLQNLGCDSSPFSLDRFLEEINIVAPSELGHIFLMLKPIHLKREHAQDLKEFNLDSFRSADESALGDSFPEKMKFLWDDFSRRGWITH